ncbi:MAG: hypothetical protein HA495_04545 [Thaumarchaeota archaeon]|nr:hypothetical protein [Nitrososphaerota archaeon]
MLKELTLQQPASRLKSGVFSCWFDENREKASSIRKLKNWNSMSISSNFMKFFIVDVTETT